MNNIDLEKIISDTQTDPYIKWNNSSLADWVRIDSEFSVYLFNRDGNHGYFSLLHNLSSNIEGTIVEAGLRNISSTSFTSKLEAYLIVQVQRPTLNATQSACC